MMRTDIATGIAADITIAEHGRTHFFQLPCNV